MFSCNLYNFQGFQVNAKVGVVSFKQQWYFKQQIVEECTKLLPFWRKKTA